MHMTHTCTRVDVQISCALINFREHVHVMGVTTVLYCVMGLRSNETVFGTTYAL